MKTVKRCEYILEDGHKCNEVFKTRSRQNSHQKYCNNHLGNVQKESHLHGHTPLVNSRNKYAQGGNNDSMRQWVSHKMRVEMIEKQRIADLEAKVKSLENKIEKIVSNMQSNYLDHKIEVCVRRELRQDFFKHRVDAIVVKRLKKSLRGEEE